MGSLGMGWQALGHRFQKIKIKTWNKSTQSLQLFHRAADGSTFDKMVDCIPVHPSMDNGNGRGQLVYSL